MASSLGASYEAAARAISKADYLLIAAGAGCSADSGLPVFAQVSSHPALVQAGLTYDQVASLDMLAKDAPLFSGFWLDALSKYESRGPHEGYSILRRWSDLVTGAELSAHAQSRQESTFVITSNVDGYFLQTGFAERVVVELHGAVRRWQCGGVPNRLSRFPLFERGRCSDTVFEVPSPRPTVDESTLRASSTPTCPNCSGGLARPNVYLFGDGSNFVDDGSAERYRQWSESTLAELRANPSKHLVILELGCGLRIPKLRKMAEQMLVDSPAKQADLIRINPDYPSNPVLSEPTISLPVKALAALKAIDATLIKEAQR